MSDDSGRFRLTRRRLLGGLAVTGAATGGAGAGTWAYFQDTESSTGNSIDAGTLDLKTSDSDDNGDGATGTWTISNARPGDSVMADLTLRNEGTESADHVEIDFSVTETEATGPSGSDEADSKQGADGMTQQFEVTLLTYNGVNILEDYMSDANGNGIMDLDDLVNGNGAALDDLTPPPSANGGSETMTMEFRWAHDSEFDSSVSGTNNDYQGDEFDLTVTYALHQDGSQDL